MCARDSSPLIRKAHVCFHVLGLELFWGKDFFLECLYFLLSLVDDHISIRLEVLVIDWTCCVSCINHFPFWGSFSPYLVLWA